MNVKAILTAFRALDRDEPALPRPVERPAEPYRGAQWARAGNGEEWLRLMALRRAGQRDMFEASECPPHQSANDTSSQTVRGTYDDHH